MIKRIAFTGNHNRTRIFRSVADQLEASGLEVFWIATGSSQMRSTLASISGEKILDLSGLIKYINKKHLVMLDECSDISVNGIIASDRILSRKPEKVSLGYLSSIFEHILRFFQDNEIEMVFGEVTWAHEMVTAAVCNYLNIPFLSPVNVRYPSGRFVFFEGVKQKKVVSYNNRISIPEGVRLNEEFQSKGNTPFYMNRVKKNILTSFFKHAYRHLTGDTKDMTVPSIYRLVSDKVTHYNVKGFQAKPSGDYVYLPLQCQPESSIDVLAGFYRSQTEFVKSVSRALPYGLKLAVKEHPLNIKWIRIRNIPAVEMISSYADSIELIKGAKAVISISGTACYEAGLYGIPAVTFTDLFFNELPTVHRCTSTENLSDTLWQAMESKPDETAVTAFLAKLFAESYEGYCESPDVYPDALTEENIRMVTFAFNNIIEGYSSKSDTADSMCSRLI